jgi:hypothetical protein
MRVVQESSRQKLEFEEASRQLALAGRNESLRQHLRRAFRHRLLLEQTSDSLRRLSTTVEPMINALAIDDHLGRFAPRVVMAEDLNKPAITRPLPLKDNNPEAAGFLLTRSSQTYSKQ